MDVWAYQDTVKRKLKDKQSFGKHRNKTTTTTTTTYHNTHKGGRNYTPDTWQGRNNRNIHYPYRHDDFLD